MCELLKVGDTIKYYISEDCSLKFIGGKPFAGEWHVAEIGAVFNDPKGCNYGHYGVYADYGQDYIHFRDAVKIDN